MGWYLHLQPLFKKYGKRQHPLEYKNKYQLVVMVVNWRPSFLRNFLP
jgi:endonuclease-3